MVFVEERLVIGFDDCRLIDSEIHMHEEGFYTGEQLGNAGDDSVLRTVNLYIDLYINRRSFLGKSVNQATIRSRIFELVKIIRNSSLSELLDALYYDIKSSSEGEMLLPVNANLSQGYSHYALARMWYNFDKGVEFLQLLRSRKHKSLVLTQIFSEEEWSRLKAGPINTTCWSLINYCLCRRDRVDEMPSDVHDRIVWLQDKGYLPEMKGCELNVSPFEFLSIRQRRMEEVVYDIWLVERLR